MAKKKENNIEEILEATTCNCGCEHENCNCDKSFENEHVCNCGSNDCSCGDECSCGLEHEHEKECREDEFKETMQRLQAEFDNYRKRTESSFEKIKEDGIIHSINKLLPVLDSFKSAKALVSNEEFLNSLNLIEKQFIDGLNALNVSKIEAENEMFNPSLHNAVLTGSDDTKLEDIILEVYQDGYKLGDRVIRYSVVKINKLS